MSAGKCSFSEVYRDSPHKPALISNCKKTPIQTIQIGEDGY